MEAIENRHSVRSYTDRRIEGEVLRSLQETVDECNRRSGLSIQLCIDEPDAFSGMMARYGKFSNVRNYIALVGKKAADLDEKCGYYGEQVVLKAQMLGLNTCWVAMSFSKRKSVAEVGAGEKLVMVISLGYGETQGRSHKMKSVEELSTVKGDAPDWFMEGMRAAQLAPTAMNQQKFSFAFADGEVTAAPGSGFYTSVDLGIARCHFDIGAGRLTLA